jgi:hypothetical protein
MSMTYVFNFDISANLFDAIKYDPDSTQSGYDLLPRPAGVGIKYIVNNGTIWGFGPLNQNFENGNFIYVP